MVVALVSLLALAALLVLWALLTLRDRPSPQPVPAHAVLQQASRSWPKDVPGDRTQPLLRVPGYVSDGRRARERSPLL